MSKINAYRVKLLSQDLEIDAQLYKQLLDETGAYIFVKGLTQIMQNIVLSGSAPNLKIVKALSFRERISCCINLKTAVKTK
jgi:hypothetical protein